MIIKRVSIASFRNISAIDIEPSEGVNVFFGGNAEGKTNLLEALSLCLGRGFRGAKMSQLLPVNPEMLTARTDLTIRLVFSYDRAPEKKHEVTFFLKQDAKKPVLSLNHLPFEDSELLYGEMKYVVFVPEDLYIIKGAPELRRNYIDSVSELHSHYHKKILRGYKTALKQAAAALASGGDTAYVWFRELAKFGVSVTYGRVKHFSLLKTFAVPIYHELSGFKENLTMSYESSVYGLIEDLGTLDFDKDKDKLAEQFFNKLDQSVVYSANHTGEPPHITAGAGRDDLYFAIDGKNAREFASQGQLRSIAVALKLAEAAVIREYSNEIPVVLLDEVLGELDAQRRHFILSRFSERAQVFITSCNAGDFQETAEYKLFHVKDGAICEQ